MRSQVLKQYLGNVEHSHPRVRVVRSYNDTHQLILKDQSKQLSQKALDYLQSLDVILDGPTVSIDFDHTKWTSLYILTQILPREAHPPPAAFEQIGHVAHLNLKQHHLPYAKVIGQVLIACNPKIKTVVNKVGEVKGDYRTYDMDLLAGTPDTRVDLIEHGTKLTFDVKDVYWCSRLSGEREYLLTQEFKQGQFICDAFCGVGALCVQAASKLGCRIHANDWNPRAIEACRQNAARNKVQFEKLTCDEAYDFVADIGLAMTTSQPKQKLPHHLVMNFPLGAARVLPALRWWPAPKRTKDVVPKIHVYTFAKEDEQRSYEDAAIDTIADHLLPAGGAVEDSILRKEELNQFGCDVQTRLIRDVAPGKAVVCVSFRATRDLIKTLQGEFV